MTIRSAVLSKPVVTLPSWVRRPPPTRSCLDSHHAPFCAIRLRLATGLAGAALASALAGRAAAPCARPAIDGDHHSPAVVDLANEALAARRLPRHGHAGAFVPYIGDRNATADAVAGRDRTRPGALRDAWARADLPHQEAVLAALTQLGVAYRSNTSDPGVGFDCSGLTACAWGRAGVPLTRQSGAQINAARRRPVRGRGRRPRPVPRAT